MEEGWDGIWVQEGALGEGWGGRGRIWGQEVAGGGVWEEGGCRGVVMCSRGGVARRRDVSG